MRALPPCDWCSQGIGPSSRIIGPSSRTPIRIRRWTWRGRRWTRRGVRLCLHGFGLPRQPANLCVLSSDVVWAADGRSHVPSHIVFTLLRPGRCHTATAPTHDGTIADEPPDHRVVRTHELQSVVRDIRPLRLPLWPLSAYVCISCRSFRFCKSMSTPIE